MNGTGPEFMEQLILNQSCYEQSKPYANAPSYHKSNDSLNGCVLKTVHEILRKRDCKS